MKELRSLTAAESRVVILLLAVLAIFAFAVGIGGTLASAQTNDDLSGTWTARTSQKHLGEIQLNFSRHRDGGFSNWGNTHKISDISGLSEAAITATSRVDVTFSLVREAGTIQAEGMFVDRMGTGFWKFVPNENFRAEMKRRGYGPLTDEEMVRSAFNNLSTKYIDELKAAGFADLDLKAVMRAASHGISSAYIREIHDAYPGLTMEQIVRARNHGVGAAYLKKVADMGFGKQPLESVIRLKNHDITSEFIASMSSAGFNNMTIDGLIRLKNHNVTPDFVAQIKAEGYTDIAPDTAIRLMNHHVDRDFIRRARSHGYTNISLEEMIRLKNRGTIK